MIWATGRGNAYSVPNIFQEKNDAFNEVLSSVGHPNFDEPEGRATLLGQLYRKDNVNDMLVGPNKEKDTYLATHSFVANAMLALVYDHDARLVE